MTLHSIDFKENNVKSRINNIYKRYIPIHVHLFEGLPFLPDSSFLLFCSNDHLIQITVYIRMCCLWDFPIQNFIYNSGKNSICIHLLKFLITS